MNVKKAINSIAEGDSLISIVANDSLKTSEGIVQFSHMIADQYNVGCGSSMAIEHGYEVINTIIKYSDNVKIQTMENLQGLEAILNNPIN